MLDNAARPMRMRKLSRNSVINQIERIVQHPVVGSGQRKWNTSGVECVLNRHSYNGDVYSFNIEVLRIRTSKSLASRWELHLVTEYWRDAEDETVHMAKWLKLITGKSKDVTKWLAESLAKETSF